MARGLTGIERQLVLRYLIDGNVPITVGPARQDGERSAQGRVFPVAVRGDQLTVLEQGIILIRAGEGVRQFVGTDVRVQFYFHRLGLYFVTTLRRVPSGPVLVIPPAILRVTDEAAGQRQGMSASLFYGPGWADGMRIDCCLADGYAPFAVPKWDDIPECDVARAKGYLARFGSDPFLIPVCRYLAHEEPQTAALQGTLRPPAVLFLDHERVVFGAETPSLRLHDGCEYALRLRFPLPPPLRAREVLLTCLVDRTFASDGGARSCALCTYTSVKEEDRRFLSELMRA